MKSFSLAADYTSIIKSFIIYPAQQAGLSIKYAAWQLKTKTL